jgi:hypothetical protein
MFVRFVLGWMQNSVYRNMRFGVGHECHLIISLGGVIESS